MEPFCKSSGMLNHIIWSRSYVIWTICHPVGLFEQTGRDSRRLFLKCISSLNTGQHTKYPANDDGISNRPCDAYDPRKRYWYIHLTEQEGITYRFFHNSKITNQNEVIDYWIDRFRLDCAGLENHVQQQCFVKEYNCSYSVDNDPTIENIFIDCPDKNHVGKNVNFIEVYDKSSNTTSVRIEMNEKMLVEDVYNKDFEFIYQQIKQKIARTKTSNAFSYTQEYHEISNCSFTSIKHKISFINSF